MKLILLGLLVTVVASSAHAQSFNCRYARQPDEIRICQDPTLRELDERLSVRFFRLRNTLSPREQARLDRSQRDWLSRRAQCGSDPDCIEDEYRSRLDRLSGW